MRIIVTFDISDHDENGQSQAATDLVALIETAAPYMVDNVIVTSED